MQYVIFFTCGRPRSPDPLVTPAARVLRTVWENQRLMSVSEMAVGDIPAFLASPQAESTPELCVVQEIIVIKRAVFESLLNGTPPYSDLEWYAVPRKRAQRVAA